MVTFLTVVYVTVCIFLILVVLLQAGRGGGMGAAFGGASQTVFGGAGAGNFLTRLTSIGALLFMALSATLAYFSSSGTDALDRVSHEIAQREKARGKQGGKAAPAPKPAGMSGEAPAQKTEEKAP